MSTVAGTSGFSYFSSPDLEHLLGTVRRDAEAFPDGGVVEELYREVCAFLDAHEDDPIVGSADFVRRSRNRGFGLLASVRGYLRMLSLVEQTDSLVFCNRRWQDAAVGDVTMDPVFEAVDEGVVGVDQLATVLFNGGVVLSEALQSRRFAVVFAGLPLFSKQPSVDGGEYQNDFPADLASAVNSTQLAELSRHLVTEGRPNQDIFTGHNILQHPSGSPADWAAMIDRACATWRTLNPDVAEPAFHLLISDIEMWGNCRGSLFFNRLGNGIAEGSLHWCPEIAELYDGSGGLWFLVAEPWEGRAAFNITRFTDVQNGWRHTPTLGVRTGADGRFDIMVDLRLRIDVQDRRRVVGVNVL